MNCLQGLSLQPITGRFQPRMPHHVSCPVARVSGAEHERKCTRGTAQGMRPAMCAVFRYHGGRNMRHRVSQPISASGSNKGSNGGPAGSAGSNASGSSWTSDLSDSEIETNRGLIGSIDETQAKVDYLGESTYGNLHFVDRLSEDGFIGSALGLGDNVDSILSAPYRQLKDATLSVLRQLDVAPSTYPDGSPLRGIFCSRTLNLRSIQAIGYDLDYTLVHYDVNAWEGKAYDYGLQWLREQGCPVEGLHFDPTLVVRGLIIDKELGNVVKVDRFGYVKRAMHGTRMLSWAEIHSAYGRELVNLRDEDRWAFLNTFFSVSEAVMFMQMVDRLDGGEVDPSVVSQSYSSLYRLVGKALHQAHVEGKLKAEILQAPERYVELDPQVVQTLLDQKQSGKQLLLITNSDWHYTNELMSYAYDRFLPAGMGWRDMFEMVIVNARKPDFFRHNMSLYEIVTPDGLMRPTYTIKPGGIYCGGSARQVEKSLGVSGDDILYVGDHIYTDAALAKLNFRWRTCLVVRELEQEVEALTRGRPHRHRLKELMNKKELIGDVFNQLRLARQRTCYRPADAQAAAMCAQGDGAQSESVGGVTNTMAQLLTLLERLDRAIGPMLEADGEHFSKRWGYLSRAGLNDKSQLTRQIEKYADVYTSRVSNFLRYTPFFYFRSPSQSLAHDRDLSEYYQRMYAAAQQQAAAAVAAEGGAAAAVQQFPIDPTSPMGSLSSLNSLDTLPLPTPPLPNVASPNGPSPNAALPAAAGSGGASSTVDEVGGSGIGSDIGGDSNNGHNDEDDDEDDDDGVLDQPVALSNGGGAVPTSSARSSSRCNGTSGHGA